MSKAFLKSKCTVSRPLRSYHLLAVNRGWSAYGAFHRNCSVKKADAESNHSALVK